MTEDQDEQGYCSEEAEQIRGNDTFRRRGPRSIEFQSCPACPEIKRKIDRIDRALLGPDGTGMKDGIVFAITTLQKSGKVQASWVNFAKPIAVAVVSSLLTFALTYGLLTHSQLATLVAKLA